MSQVDPRPQHGAGEITWGRLLTITSRMGLCLSCPRPPSAPLHTPVPSGSCDRVGTEDKLQAAAGGKKCRRWRLSEKWAPAKVTMTPAPPYKMYPAGPMEKDGDWWLPCWPQR
ncbi:unnamed protein product [Rangifer tarandus platyrhynchus]|uniref:Uncharacterized protein n=1 Tax=Rangifer tarandus platyrhynchus TaxID=3082113 RepID=A0AC59YE99_RANTA